jgi:hypothetical protein
MHLRIDKYCTCFFSGEDIFPEQVIASCQKSLYFARSHDFRPDVIAFRSEVMSSGQMSLHFARSHDFPPEVIAFRRKSCFPARSHDFPPDVIAYYGMQYHLITCHVFRSHVMSLR